MPGAAASLHLHRADRGCPPSAVTRVVTTAMSVVTTCGSTSSVRYDRAVKNSTLARVGVYCQSRCADRRDPRRSRHRRTALIRDRRARSPRPTSRGSVPDRAASRRPWRSRNHQHDGRARSRVGRRPRSPRNSGGALRNVTQAELRNASTRTTERFTSPASRRSRQRTCRCPARVGAAADALGQARPGRSGRR